MESAFRDRGVNLIVELSDELPRVMVDPARIGHVFSNLLSNALKYTPPGGDVRVMAEHKGSLIEVSVQDTGSGIPKQHIDRIFERFFRVPGQAGNTGAGLGLAIAKEIVELHGGRLSVSSQEGQGSTFTFTLSPAEETAVTHVSSNGKYSDRHEPVQV
jgi:signal transduction histidine kinase